jgi:anti-sigma factor RsiW
MSCPPEFVLSVYVDGELETDERRPLEAHLVSCASCRARVLALREEAETLVDALLGRARAPVRRPARVAPARGLALGAAPVIGAVALAAAVTGWLLEARFMAFSPFRLVGVFDMGFDLLFMLRDRAPELFAITSAVAALAGVSAVLSFALGALLRRVPRPGALGLAVALATLAAPEPARAHFGLHRHQDFVLAAGETHTGTLVASGDVVNIDGVVDGDLVVLAERLAVRGEVRGNLFALARNFELEGRVQGIAACMCARAYLRGEIGSDLYGLAEDLVLAAGARVARNFTYAAENAVIEGSVGRDLAAASERTELRGTVARNLYAWETEIVLRNGARVGGDINAYLDEDGAIDVAPGAVVAGKTTRHAIPYHHQSALGRYREPGFYALHAILFAAAFLVGMIAHLLFPGIYAGHVETSGAFFRTLGIGFLALVATPIALALLAVTLVGLPLALIGAAAYGVAVYLSGIVVAALVGRTLVRVDPGSLRSFGLALLAGLLVVLVVVHLPWLGWLVHAVVILTGLGLLVERARHAWRARTAVV